MRYLVLSDIHANLEALDTVLEAAADIRTTGCWCWAIWSATAPTPTPWSIACARSSRTW